MTTETETPPEGKCKKKFHLVAANRDDYLYYSGRAISAETPAPD